jgi:maltokinase
MNDADELLPLIRLWLPSQRWFGGKGRTASVQIEALATLRAEPPQVTIWAAHVHYDDSTTETYQLPLVTRTEPNASLEHALVGSVFHDDEPRWVYDALHDKDVTQLWPAAIRAGRVDGVLHFERTAEPEAIPVDEPSLVLTAEQSNTSLMFGDTAILKVFRRLQPGINPDIEVHAALGARGGRHVARLLGSVRAELAGGSSALAMLQEYMTTATDGWDLAKASVRDLMAEADLHAEEAGGDFAGEAHRLGIAVAEVHQDLAAAFGVTTAAPDLVLARVAAMQARLDHALSVVPELTALAGGLRETYRQVVADGESLALQRIHGDLHLAQALRTAQRWVIIDFEGEPAASFAERRAPDSPLRDIAGMLRSFEYAGHHRVVEGGFDAQLAYRAGEWAQRNRTAFCEGYAEAAGADPREHAALLRAYEADKAVYEAVYEARNRPTWLPIPLASLHRLAEQGAA